MASELFGRLDLDSLDLVTAEGPPQAEEPAPAERPLEPAAQAPHASARATPRTRLGRAGQDFARGFLAPLHVLRQGWTDPAFRRAYVRVVGAQMAIIVAATATLVSLAGGDAHKPSKHGHGTGRHEAPVDGGPVHLASPVGALDVSSRSDGGKRNVRVELPGGKVLVNAEVDDDDEDDEDDEEGAAAASSNDAAGDGGAAAPLADETEGTPVAPWLPFPSLRRAYGRLLAVIATTLPVQWIVIALSRDYHDWLGYELSLRAQVPPDQGPVTPRVRLNLRWVFSKVRRRMRGFVVVALGLPALGVLLLGPAIVLGQLGPIGSKALELVTTGLFSAWAFYWLGVFTAGKSGLAWRPESAPRDPWFLRLWDAFAAPLGVLRWWGRLWRRLTGDALLPAARVDRVPITVGGLTAFRVLLGVPGIYVLIRPLIPVASAALLTSMAAMEPGAPERPSSGPAGSP